MTVLESDTEGCVLAHKAMTEGCGLLDIKPEIMRATPKLHRSHCYCPVFERILHHCLCELPIHLAHIIVDLLPQWVLRTKPGVSLLYSNLIS